MSGKTFISVKVMTSGERPPYLFSLELANEIRKVLESKQADYKALTGFDLVLGQDPQENIGTDTPGTDDLTGDEWGATPGCECEGCTARRTLGKKYAEMEAKAKQARNN